MPPPSRTPKCLPSSETARPPFRASEWSAILAGRRGSGAARVHRGSETSTRPLVHRCRGGFEAACARSTSASGRLHEHDCGPAEHPDHRIRGRDDCLVGRKSPFGRQPPELLGVRGREHRVSTLPTRIAPGRDFAPTPTAPGHLLSRATRSSRSGETRGESVAAAAKRACTARSAKGS